MPRQYFFWKYLNTIIVLYCIIVQKSPIIVQLSPIQCTYSNIFIRFFKFSPANTNIYQNSYSLQCGDLISFGTKYLMSLQFGVPSGRLPRYARNDKVLRTEGKRMKSIAKTDKVFVWFILCHSEELYSNDVRIPRKGTLS